MKQLLCLLIGISIQFSIQLFGQSTEKIASDLLYASDSYKPEKDTLMLFGQFVGSWDLDATWYAKDGTVTTGKGEWHFMWILGGRGIQDVLFAKGAPNYEYGTTVRGYDRSIGAWRVTWMQPAGPEFGYLIGRKIGNRIELEVTGLPMHHRIRWSFNDITASQFVWMDEESFDFGKTWKTRQVMKAKRK